MSIEQLAKALDTQTYFARVKRPTQWGHGLEYLIIYIQ